MAWVLATWECDLGTRVAGPKIRNHGHRQVIADGQGGTQSQSPYRVFARQRLFESPGLGQQSFGLGSKPAPQSAELQAFAHPVKQPHPELVLQFLERAAGRGLGHRQARGCPGDIFMMRGGQEH